MHNTLDTLIKRTFFSDYGGSEIVGRLTTGVTNRTNMTVNYFQELSGVDLLRVLFSVPREEILSIIHQDEAKAKEYALAAYLLFQKKYKVDIQSRSSELTTDYSLGLDVLKKHVFDGIAFQQCSVDHSKSISSISAASKKAQYFLKRHWNEFKECLIAVTDPYYDTHSSEAQQAQQINDPYLKWATGIISRNPTSSMSSPSPTTRVTI